MSEVLIERRSGPLLTLSLNRPERRNALNGPLLDDLVAALERAAANPDIGAVLLKGEGSTFCVGGDVKTMADAG